MSKIKAVSHVRNGAFYGAMTALAAVLLFAACSDMTGDNPITPPSNETIGSPEPAFLGTADDRDDAPQNQGGNYCGGDCPLTNCNNSDRPTTDDLRNCPAVTPDCRQPETPSGGRCGRCGGRDNVAPDVGVTIPDCGPVDTMPIIPLPDTNQTPDDGVPPFEPPPFERPELPLPDFHILECDRSGLSRAMNYFKMALIFSDHRWVPFTDGAKYFEKDYTAAQVVTREIPFNQARWWEMLNSPEWSPLDMRFDIGACAASAEMTVGSLAIGLRVEVADGKVSEIFAAIRNANAPNFDLDRCLADAEDCAPTRADGPQRGVSCTDFGLREGAMSAYQTAMSWVDYTRMPLAANAKYIEADYTGSNASTRILPFGAGLWETHIQWNGWSSENIIVDVANCAVFTEMPVLVSTLAPSSAGLPLYGCERGDFECYRDAPPLEFTSRIPYVHGIRLKVSGDRITEVLVIRTDVGGRRINAEGCLRGSSVRDCLLS